MQEDPGLEGKGGPWPRLGGQHGLLLALGAPLCHQQKLPKQKPGGEGRGVGRCLVLPGVLAGCLLCPSLTSPGPGGPQSDRGSHAAVGLRTPAGPCSCRHQCPVPPARRSRGRGPWCLEPLEGRKQTRPSLRQGAHRGLSTRGEQGNPHLSPG